MSRHHEHRSNALHEIAILAATSPLPSESSFAKLYTGLSRRQQARASAGPVLAHITYDEIDILFALCNVAPLVNNQEKAAHLLKNLSLYLLEALQLDIQPSPFVRNIQPSPWEALTLRLTKAILILGIRYSQLREAVLECMNEYLISCDLCFQKTKSNVEVEDNVDLAATTVSLLGFLEATANHANFFRTEELIETVQCIRRMLDEKHLVKIEAVFSSIRASEKSEPRPSGWNYFSKRYAAACRPLGAMLLQQSFLKVLVSASSLQVVTANRLISRNTLDYLALHDESMSNGHHESSGELVTLMTQLATDSLRMVDDSPEFLQASSAWHQSVAFSTKASCLHTYVNCVTANDGIADADLLMSWLQATMADPVSMADETLAAVVLKCIAIMAKLSPSAVPQLSRSLPRFLVQSGIKGDTVDIAARSLTSILRLMSQDAIITGIYSLGNVLSAVPTTDRTAWGNALPNGTVESSKAQPQQSQGSMLNSTGSVISLNLSGEEETSAAYGNVIRAIVCIALNCQDESIAALAQSMLLQKLGRVNLAADLHIVRETANLAVAGGVLEFKSLMKLYSRLGYDASKARNDTMLGAVRSARMRIVKDLKHSSPYYVLYLTTLLESVISKGDVHEGENTHQDDVDLAAREITELVFPLAALASIRTDQPELVNDEKIARLHREAWFNVVVHGVTPTSTHGQRCATELRTLAIKSKALIPESRGDQFESDIELNTVLRRGMNGPNTAEQKRRLIQLLPKCEADIKSLSYPKVVFLLSMFLVETLRAEAGDCSHILTYFLEPSLNGTAMENCTSAVAEQVMALYLRWTSNEAACAPSLVANQLASMFMGCCHRIPRVQQIAALSADRVISHLPSALCQKSSLFALLELLTILWTSCLEIELDEYELKATYSSARGNVSVELSDDYDYRRATLDNLYKRAKSWVTHVVNIAPLNVKGLLQTYLSEYSDDGIYGHMALGRSFAADMGAIVSASDYKLAVTDRHGECNINIASDFIAQYTSRQEYKYADDLPSLNADRKQSVHLNKNYEAPVRSNGEDQEEGRTSLDHLEARARDGKHIAPGELRDSLRRAAALLCKSNRDECATLRQLVGIPFTIFTKQSIKLGISLWMNIMNEAPNTEPKILALVAEGWEKSIRGRIGAFSPKLYHADPFYLKEEFAPSQKTITAQQQQAAHDLMSPHLRLLQFLMSHFNANRIGNPQAQQIFLRLVRLTLGGVKQCAGHPLAREFYFQIVLFGLTILRYATGLSQDSRWQLKDAALSAGLAWFCHPPRFSFGGNRLQIKAEIRLMADVDAALRSVSTYFAQPAGYLPSLATKQELLTILLDSEHTRLLVWLFPLDHERRRILPKLSSSKGLPEAALSQILRTAWRENPTLALRMTSRFPSARLHNEVRALLLTYPDNLVDEPDALHILIGASLPSDITTQLRYLLYWAPVNPVTAVTYFLPEYNNNPYIVQYAVRALESHSVDVTFFYVPQIVQTLRYDVLGYVQRYILETAQFSQLFAHQIIWNMTANAYKDEDSSIEDSLKPTLDIIKERMVRSFSGEDKDFYEREFTFFDEITGISGKLRSLVKKSKPEKKAKIEEELRAIKVDVGVYLPSNPDGTVIGIDRKSGKPLQSHAKAPYMATFRIRKSRGGMEASEDMITNEDTVTREGAPCKDHSYEVWQSAIFKVGDDCRQDILALQMIAAFRGIFNDVGLDVYVYPYRVTATAPGCGVIDVLPNSISRDMLGREAINGLYEYFVSKYGTETSIAFQEARNNFVKSMAAYSVISYLLQFKDRHNGNIMIDDAGHILHIDFGFCFDIAPGGVRFERAPFKLTYEMIAVMGGNTTSQSFKWFEELCIKAFLASRAHAEKLCHIVVLMLGSGLPCFKPETIKHLRERFVLEKNEREAADFMRDLIKKSYGSYSTKGYDQFQLLTNGIPY